MNTRDISLPAPTHHPTFLDLDSLRDTWLGCIQTSLLALCTTYFLKLSKPKKKRSEFTMVIVSVFFP